MSFLRRQRLRAGALIRDWPVFEMRMRRRGAPDGWLLIRNRDEDIGTDGRGVSCRWRFTSDLHIARVFPATGIRLMKHAFAAWPVAMGDAPMDSKPPEVSFLIGHRGLDRLPHLLTTLSSIAGQRGAAIECIVVEQAAAPEIPERLPAWVRYVHTPVSPDASYNRGWAFNVAARMARSRVLICHDNDLLIPADYAAEARDRIGEGWSFLDLKRFLFYLPAEETARVLGGGAVRSDVVTAAIVQNARGGSIVAERDAYSSIGGFDEAFIGWGGEDNDFWDRAETMKVYAFGYLPMIHLDHPFQSGKWSESSDAVARYRAIESIPPRERIASLLRRKDCR